MGGTPRAKLYLDTYEHFLDLEEHQEFECELWLYIYFAVRKGLSAITSTCTNVKSSKNSLKYCTGSDLDASWQQAEDSKLWITTKEMRK